MKISTVEEMQTAATVFSKMMIAGKRQAWLVKKLRGNNWSVSDRSTNLPNIRGKHHHRLIDVVNFLTYIYDPCGDIYMCPADKEMQFTHGDLTFSMVRYDNGEFSLLALKGEPPTSVPITSTGRTGKCCCSKPECLAKEAALRAADMD